MDEFNKIMLSPEPSKGILLLDESTQDNGTHVEVYQFLYIFHFFVLRKFQTVENACHHALPDMIVSIKRPALSLYEFFRYGLGYIVQQSSPSQPQIPGIQRKRV